MKKEKLFKNKKRGQGFAEYALLAGGLIIIVAFAVIALRPLFRQVDNYLACLLRVATARVGETQNPPQFDACNACFDPSNNQTLCDNE